jgi:flagellar hook protein FlgE
LGNFPRDSMSGLEPVRLDQNQYVANPTTMIQLGANLPATSTLAGADGDTFEMSVQYTGNLGTQETLTYVFTPSVPTTGYSNTWSMAISDSASDGAEIAEYTLTFDDTQGSGGTLASVTTVTGDDYDPANGAIPLTVGGGVIQMNIGTIGATGGMTQLSENFAPIGKASNGTPVARLVSVDIDDNGRLHANYDQGFSKTIYQIPVVDVPNPNGLTSSSNQTYQVSAASGPFYLWDSGDGPTGKLIGYSQEQSTTDVTQELTSLITTQRAYSSNVKIIQTVDEMLQETTNLKR